MPPNNDIERRIETATALTQLQSDVRHCTDKITENSVLTDKLLKVLHGDGNVGLITKTALNTQSLGRLWKWVAFLSSAIIAGAVELIWRGLG